MKWSLVKPIERAPWVTGCRETHVLAENEHCERFFVPRERVGQSPIPLEGE